MTGGEDIADKAVDGKNQKALSRQNAAGDGINVLIAPKFKRRRRDISVDNDDKEIQLRRSDIFRRCRS